MGDGDFGFEEFFLFVFEAGVHGDSVVVVLYTFICLYFSLVGTLLLDLLFTLNTADQVDTVAGDRFLDTLDVFPVLLLQRVGGVGMC